MKNTLHDSFSHLMSLAQRSHQKGDLPMAINLYKEALKVIPKQPDALHLLGIAYCSQQNFSQGIIYLEKAATALPDHAVVLTNLSNAYLKVEEYSKALPLLQKSVTIKPDFDEAWHKLANTLKALNRIEEAIQAYHKTLELNPNHFNAYYNLGNTMMLLGNYKTAIAQYEKSISLQPDFASAHNNLGIVLLEWDRVEEAEQHYLRALQLQPGYTEAIKNLVQLYHKAGKEQEAMQWNKELLRLNPDHALLRFAIETHAPVIAVSNAEIDAYRHHIVSLLDNANPMHFNSVEKLTEYACHPSSDLIYQGRLDRTLKEKYVQLFQALPRAMVQHTNSKPRVGFVVTAGHEGVFLKCMKGILNHINTDLFEVSVVCSLPNGEKIIAPALNNSAIKFVNLPAKFNEAYQLLVYANFDVLHYWEIGTDATNYFLALTKPAKIQVTSWGWPSTSGMKTVDYFISQKNLEPQQAQEHYTEKLVLFDKLPVYYYRPQVPASLKTLASYGLPNDKHLYLCQQNLRKVHPDFDAVVASILERDKEGMVLFIKDKQDAITRKLQQRLSSTMGPAFSRVIFLERMPEEDYLGLLSQCSVALDTLHYGGGANTIYDAIQAEVPVITLEGYKHSGRFATAALRQLKATDTIAYTVQEYVDKAVAVASDASLRLAIVEKMKRGSSAIFEDLEAVRELENFFLEKIKEQL
ncbi:MAG: lipoprotein [Chitinophagaceae bacterium]|nr:lipoprotein [Chitinophagaceae bacterium]